MAKQKQCRHCLRTKPVTDFSTAGRRTTKSGEPIWRSVCKTCNSQKTRERQKSDPNYARRRRELRLLNDYGITLAEYEAMFTAQNGVCLLCQRPETAINHRTGEPFDCLVVDHDHENGKVRGLLCHRCNRALGLLADDPEILRRAADYVTFHRIVPEEVTA